MTKIARLQWIIAISAILLILAHLICRFILNLDAYTSNFPLFIILFLGGGILTADLINKAIHLQFGSDLLAGISIITSVFLDEYLAGSFVVLMLSGGQAIEEYALRSASSVLAALAKRMPTVAHKIINNKMVQVDAHQIIPGDPLIILPHETTPVDGTVVEGRTSMDESYLTGEPFKIEKVPGCSVMSGSINGDHAITIIATALAKDSRYQKIVQVMSESQQRRPKMRRLGDSLGAWYTPIALIIAIAAWITWQDPLRFLAVLVVATPCPLLIAIPISIIGAISLAAKRGIIIKDPVILEQISRCRTIIFDKTGTLTYGEPTLTEIITAPNYSQEQILSYAAALETYSKHPLASAIKAAAHKSNLVLPETNEISEPPGQGLRGRITDKTILLTSRKLLPADQAHKLPPLSSGLECIVLVNENYAATLRFRDTPRSDSKTFISHLSPLHNFSRSLIVSGDRESEVQYLAEQVGINLIHASKSPEEKVQIVKDENKIAPVLFIGDGINDAPALTAATAGIAFGARSDITSEAAGAVILEPSLKKVDELLHISRHLFNIALQSALGGMALSIAGMVFAAVGLLPPLAGAITQEIIDLFAVANSLRAAKPPKILYDC